MRLCSSVLWLVLGVAATAAAEGPVVGVKAGANFAELHFGEDGEEDVDFDRLPGFVGGLFLIWPSDGPLALQVEGLVSRKGAELNAEGLNVRLTVDYIDMPILARLSTARSRAASFHVFGGPSVGVRFRARQRITIQGQTDEGDAGGDIKRMDVGLVAGAGVDVGHFTFDARHAWGLTNINDGNDEDTEIKNRVFSVMAGVRF
jgi:hypothetical protein